MTIHGDIEKATEVVPTGNGVAVSAPIAETVIVAPNVEGIAASLPIAETVVLVPLAADAFLVAPSSEGPVTAHVESITATPVKTGVTSTLTGLIEGTEGIFYKRNEDGINIYTLGTSSPVSVDKWLDHVVNLIKNWPDEKPCAILYDMTRVSIFRLRGGIMPYESCDPSTIGVTEENNERIRVILKSRSKLQIRLAIVVKASLSARVTTVLANTTFLYKRKFFGALDAAMTWLNKPELKV
jgi:hypothetical protein